MKHSILLLSFLIASPSFASEGITCVMKRLKAGPGPSSVQVVVNDLSESQEDGIGSDGLDVGKRNYSFWITTAVDRKNVELSVLFQENNEVEDEVGSTSWSFTRAELAKADAKPILSEPLEMNDKKILDFSCYYKAR